MLFTQGAVHLTTSIPLHHHSRARLARLAVLAMAPEPEPDGSIIGCVCPRCGADVGDDGDVLCADCAADAAFCRNPW